MKLANTYLVTGAAGFIGVRFVEAISKSINSKLNGSSVILNSVILVDKKIHFQDRHEIKSILEECASQQTMAQQIVDREELLDWLQVEKPKLKAILHLGACTNTMENDVAYLHDTNVVYSQRLWQYAAEKQVPFYYASSASTYGDGTYGYEDDEALIPYLKPLNPYGDSKQEFDLWVLDQDSRGIRPPCWAGFKFFNVFGFGERHKGPMASVALHAFDQIRESGMLKLFKSGRDDIPDGLQKRDFIAVEDVVDVLLFAIEKPIYRGIYNLGTGQSRSFLDFARAVFNGLNKPENIQFIDMPDKIGSRYQYFTEARVARLRERGYTKPFTSLEEGVWRYCQRLLL